MFALISTQIPAIQLLKRKGLSKGAKSLLNGRVLVFLFCAFLMLVSHGAYYGFFSIHLENLGYGSTFIGLTWAFASAAEILVMIRSDQIFRRFSLESVLIFSFMVAALRWFVLFWAQSAAVILLSQVLHAITYGTFHIASILYIDRLTPDRAKTMGQAVNNAVSYGLGLMVGFFFNGYLYEISGSFTLFMISSLIALAGGLFFGGFYLVDRKRNP
jgi:PPP family 3-phenylpropionic acid transporter